MDVKEAIAKAKSYVQEIFQDEHITNLGLDEVEHQDGANVWSVTIGFSRPWNSPRRSRHIAVQNEEALGQQALRRSYKIVRVDENGKILSLKNRPVEGNSE